MTTLTGSLTMEMQARPKQQKYEAKQQQQQKSAIQRKTTWSVEKKTSRNFSSDSNFIQIVACQCIAIFFSPNLLPVWPNVAPITSCMLFFFICNCIFFSFPQYSFDAHASAVLKIIVGGSVIFVPVDLACIWSILVSTHFLNVIFIWNFFCKKLLIVFIDNRFVLCMFYSFILVCSPIRIHSTSMSAPIRKRIYWNIWQKNRQKKQWENDNQLEK